MTSTDAHGDEAAGPEEGVPRFVAVSLDYDHPAALAEASGPWSDAGVGARPATHQPDARWTVLLDPAGHPFCITQVTPPG